MPARGRSDRPADEHLTSHRMDHNVNRILEETYSVCGNRRPLAEPGEGQNYARVPGARTAERSATKPLPKPDNDAKICIATLNLGSLSGRS
ncbi:hypothetical protein Y032_0504g2654 [Ancylostoma ceylanicum]|uniref:Uncharacterized protein n=1 Tax=Ancylostoma ceylanicum TaxID=53326 RepID=A0A016WVR6_9BILA|nr:hypothetical protein Y032_0504g2654 [Ancylostoma ceylanicum]